MSKRETVLGSVVIGPTGTINYHVDNIAVWVALKKGTLKVGRQKEITLACWCIGKAIDTITTTYAVTNGAIPRFDDGEPHFGDSSDLD